MKKEIEKIILENKKYTQIGKIPDYIPELYKPQKRSDIGLTFIDNEKNIYKCGKTEEKFTIQSISKVITLILAILDNGFEKVFERVGYEGTDDPFNSFIKLDYIDNKKPANPLINSGALVVTSLIKGKGNEKFNRILEFTRKIAKNDSIKLNEKVYKSEKETGYRNQAIASLLKSKDLLVGDLDIVLDTYFKQCSMNVTTTDLANIARFISNDFLFLDIDQKTRKKLSVLIKVIMNNCGMYDYSTEYSIKVGIPSKSGVGGGILGVLPNKMGIGVYSPALDEHGNSIVGMKIMEDLSNKFNWNIYGLNFK
ncbi:MAG: glutaminase A [Bacillota bacterium]